MFKYLHIIKQYYSVKYLVQQINLTNQSKKAKVSCSFNATMFGNSIPGPRSNNKVAISMQMHPKVRVGFKLATNSIQFYVFAN